MSENHFSSIHLSRTDLARIFSRIAINPDTNCWEWHGTKTRGGYGLVHWHRKYHLVHRLIFQAFIHKLPGGRETHCDHLCRVRHCANPAHIEIVSLKENVLRGVGITAQYARNTHCKYGHEFTESNTNRPPSGGRYCKTCARDRYHKNKKWNDRVKKTHCPQGHPFTPENRYVSKKGNTYCIPCSRERSRNLRLSR